MNERIKRLRDKSLSAINRISAERALLVTEFYKSKIAGEITIPVQRAMNYKYIMENKLLYLGDDELIVGERGPEPKATPTYPEITVHSLKDLEILHNRKKVSFKSDTKTRKAYEEIIMPFWSGKNNRDKIMTYLGDDWKAAYAAGVFTEFQEQRAPGHTVAGDKIYKKGMLDILQDVKIAKEKIDFFNDSKALDKLEELKAMEISVEGILIYAKRYASLLKSKAESEKNILRKQELEKMAIICENIPANAPKTFHEALQTYWFVHLSVITELNPWDSFNPGRLDQHLYPFYKKELEAQTLAKEEARELLQAFWIKFNNHPSPPKIGVTALESNTYTDFALINIGGLKADGSNAVNELSYLILDVIEEMRILQPSSMVQLSKKNPDRFIKRTLEITKTGFGQPSIFNADSIIQEMLAQGKNIEDARNGGASGCIETGAFGKEAYFLTGYFNLTKILELTLNNGFDPLTKKQIGLKTGSLDSFKSFSDLKNAYKKQLNHFINIKIKGNNIIESVIAQNLPAPFLSLIIDDCITNATDYNAGGARYNTSYIQGVGLGTLTDSFTAIKYHVFDKKTITLQKFKEAIDTNFENSGEFRHQLVNETPKYGNDNEYADEQVKFIFDTFHHAVDGKPTPRGGVHRINLLPTTSHVYFGSVLQATPDGRKAGLPISEGISPVQGADRNGPTAVLNSAAKIDQLKTGGTLLNQRFAPDFFEDGGINKLSSLIRSYFRMDGHHIQFNVVDSQTLLDAQKHPENYTDLIVRVAGYSDYFNDLAIDLQNEIIKRTEHQDI